MADILVVPGRLFPGKLQHCFDVGPQHVGLLASAGHRLEPHDLLADLFLRLLICVELLQLLQEAVCVGAGILLPQLLLDHFKLFP